MADRPDFQSSCRFFEPGVYLWQARSCGLFMTEKAAVFGWVIFGKRRLPLRTVTGLTCLFRFFFVHVLKAGMDFIIWQPACCLLWGGPEKQEESGAHDNEQKVIQPDFFAGGLWGFGGEVGHVDVLLALINFGLLLCGLPQKR
jgi:hypothetical protein